MKFLPRWLGGGIRRVPGLQTNTPLVTFDAVKRNVNEQTAMQISAVWAAVDLKSRILASMAIHFYSKREDGRDPFPDHPLLKLLNDKPNRYQTRVEFFETLGLNLYLTGNGYVRITRDGAGRIRSLMPLMSAQMEVELMEDGSVVYTYTDGRNIDAYASENIWHIKLFGNGIQGLSPLRYAVNSIGTSISGEEWASRIVGNGGKPTGVLSMDRVLNPEQRTQLRDRFKELKEGPADSLMVLEAGMKYTQVSLSPQDVQLLEARRFQIEDIARFFGVPSVLINDTSGSTVWGSGIQEIINGWYKIGFRPELERFEHSIRQHLIDDGERDKLAIEFDFEELLRTDFKTRVETGAKAVNAGLMSRNEWRKREWLPAVDGGDDLTVQTNLTPVEELARIADENGT